MKESRAGGGMRGRSYVHSCRRGVEKSRNKVPQTLGSDPSLFLLKTTRVAKIERRFDQWSSWLVVRCHLLESEI